METDTTQEAALPNETPAAIFAAGLAHLRTACVELYRAQLELNEVNDYSLKSSAAPLSLKEWHALFRLQKRVEQTYRKLSSRAQKGAK